jgi:hypothetical protein
LVPQVLPAGQVVGQASSCPQLSPMVPQYCSPLARLQEVILMAWQAVWSGPQTWAVTAPHCWPAGQVAAQLSGLPQPSPMLPQ